MLECVVNISEGRNQTVLDTLTAAVGDDLLDLHVDAHHHRSVFTLVGEAAPRQLAERAVELIDLRAHAGVHPRIGVVDVVPFVPLRGATMLDAARAREQFCIWAGTVLSIPCFHYGADRSLPDVRRGAFTSFGPDCGPAVANPSVGACAVGARPLLVAYNIWVAGADLAAVRRCATAVRGPHLRTLGLQVGNRLQVSCNLISPLDVGPAEAVAAVTAEAPRHGLAIVGTELVGLIPEEVLVATPRDDWDRLDLAVSRTIEARLARTS